MGRPLTQPEHQWTSSAHSSLVALFPDHKLNSYIYERAGSCLFDNEWLDFGHDFLQQLLDIDEDVPDEGMYDDWYDDHDDNGGVYWPYDEELDEDMLYDLLYGGHREY
ncbi:uncharacterized protein LOC125178304 [Hyalella azteca]|uniref:Uncharacterized protein LOC125178304 n=1 Tax=Hyalella azteca TaxID=294128 RepID=A0A979FMG6_HYAAZ|nr:uncharacterized protein LOC125178304 [Hyalella azteca]